MRSLPLGGSWRHGDFRRLWAGQTISQFGSQVTLLALPLVAAVLLEASPFEMGLLAALEMAPFLLVGLPAGVWVDRWPRRPVLIVGDVGRALVLASVPLAYVLGRLSLPQLYLVAFVSGTLTVFFDVAYMSYLPSLMTRDRLVEGNSKLETTRAAAQIGGPGLAGVLIQAFSAPVAIAADAVSFVISAAFCLAISSKEKLPSREAMGKRVGMGTEIGDGLSFVLSHPLLRAIATTTALANLSASAIMALYVLFAVRELGLEAGMLGLIFGLANFGFLVGALLAEQTARRVGVGPTIVASSLLSALGLLLVPLAARSNAIAVLIASGLIASLAVPIYNINQVSLRQAICPQRLQGRMNATMRFLVWGTMPLGSLLGGMLGEALGLRAALAVVALLGLSCFLPVLFSPVHSLQQQPEPLPD
ncbi:MAG: MFS transporter [Chloroflexi bacterium]|nr:MFS transporter [Chloroflexota bacterium]MCL5109140.1 MFS transporter [Chloroflexota bacterium]